ncbi:MAG: hypothetical protein JO260_08750 [Acidobacteria bacterium]|nr:hypothetical protein [Acidobacteriota bacterium]
MPNAETLVQKFDRSLPLSPRFRTGVSLHSHTMHSREYLGSLPRYLTHIPIASYIIEREVGRVHLLTHRVFDFRRMYWTPPLSPREAFELEQKQIEEMFGLSALVSLSDHDSIEAGLGLRMLSQFPHAERTPISVEWTLPYEQTVFHFGIHNLPLARAKAWMDELAAYTANPHQPRLREILHGLSNEPDTLLIFNHPFWDVENAGVPQQHRDCIAIFLQKYGHMIHALELNGMRSRKENKMVLELAETVDMPVVAGGDRHGCEPNATLNLSAATTFAEFAAEIRVDRQSHVVLMPQYFEPLRHRILESAWHALGDAPGEFGRRHWMSRIFIEGDDGSTRPVSEFTGTRFQSLVDKFRWVMAFLVSPQVRPAVRLAFLGQEDGGR